MQLTLVRHLWGIPQSWEESFPRIAAAGYRAIEAPLPAPEDRPRFRALLEQHQFAYIAMIFTSGAHVAEHVASFRAQVADAQTVRPMLINSHSGRDGWNDDDNAFFFDQALMAEQEQAIPIAHETHRGRILYNPWVTSRMLGRFPTLRLCCDYSHWVCVTERLLETEQAIIEQCAAAAIHLHARVGYEEGPQVPDPRAPEYLRHVEAHEAWWKLIWRAQMARGDAVSTLTPEYGPPSYLHTLPYTQAPVSNLWDICDWQAQREAELFQACN